MISRPACSRPSFVSFFFFQAEDGIRDLIVTGVQTCALPILPAFVWEYSTGFVLQPTVLTFSAIVFVTIFSTIVAFASWTRGVELIGPNRAGVFLHLIPIFSALLTGVLLGEPLMGYHVVGFALILLGVWCAARG